MNERIFGNDLILKKILSSIPTRQLLLNCSRVCSKWENVCKRVITQRTGSLHTFHVFRIGRHHHRHGAHQEQHLNDELNAPFISNSFDELEEALKNDMMSSLHSLPHLGLVFCGSFCPHSKRVDKIMQYSTCRRFLPPYCQFLNIVSSAGLIGSPYGHSVPIETQAHVGNVAGVSVLLLPKHPGVEVDVFDDRNLIPLEKLNARDDLKCILVFATSCTDGKDQFKEFPCINNLLQKYNKKLALGGVVIDEANWLSNNTPSARKKSRELFGVAFSGANVRACSLLLKTDTQQLTECRLQEFRNNLGFNPDCVSSETIGFIFICTGRGIHTYGTSNVEATLFRKVFPHVRLCGVFGHGEFGHDFWPSLEANKKTSNTFKHKYNEQDCDEHEFWHFYTSIVVIINLPKK